MKPEDLLAALPISASKDIGSKTTQVRRVTSQVRDLSTANWLDRKTRQALVTALPHLEHVASTLAKAQKLRQAQEKERQRRLALARPIIAEVLKDVLADKELALLFTCSATTVNMPTSPWEAKDIRGYKLNEALDMAAWNLIREAGTAAEMRKGMAALLDKFTGMLPALRKKYGPLVEAVTRLDA